MAFNSTSGRIEYTASSGQTVFNFAFKIYEDTDIKVYQTPSGQTPNDISDLLVLTTDYTVSIVGDSGGSITLVSGAGTGDSVTLVRELPIARDTDYQTNGDLLADTLNLDQDYQTYLIADKDAQNERFLTLPENAQAFSQVLPFPTANYGMFVNSAGTAFEFRVGDENGAALKAWEAEAEQLTSKSYAIEAEDVFVKTYTSDDDGTFTATDTTDYSSYHWSQKAATFNPALYATLTGATFTGAISGTSASFSGDISAANISSGTYTPTISGTTNISNSGAGTGFYIRVGNTVHVTGGMTITQTALATGTSFKMSLPIASNLTSTQGSLQGLGSTASITGATSQNTTIFADTTNNVAQVHTYADATSIESFDYSFSYTIA